MFLLPSFRSVAIPAALSALLITFTGCGFGTQVTATADPQGVVSGIVFGGQQPIAGATVNLVLAGTSGYGSTPQVIATTTTGADGSYTLPAHSACSVPDSLVYVQAVSGNAGTDTGINSAIDLVSIPGKCSSANSSAKVSVNEATTIAAAYVLAPFAKVTAAGTGIGTSSTNITGLNNAIGPANTLVSSVTGAVNQSSTSAGLVLPTTLINTLADILAACTNSGSSASANCNTLLTATTVNGVRPLDTFQAALNIALHPASSTSALFGLASASGPFQPTVPTATPPSDFTVAIGYNGGGIAPHGVNAVAIDASGNAWVTDYFTNSASTLTGLIEITPTAQYPGGTTGFGNGTLYSLNNLAIDQQGIIWVTNTGNNAITGLTSSGSIYTSVANTPNDNGIAIDSLGDIWWSGAGNTYNNISEIVNVGGGNYAAGSTFTAIDHFGVDVCTTPGYIYGISYGSTSEPSSFTQYNLTTMATNGVTPDSGDAGLSGCAVDNAGNLWLPDSGNFNGVEVYTQALNLLESFQITAPVYPQEIALDGLGNVFVATYVPQGTASYNSATANPASLVEFTAAGALVSPSFGYLPTSGQQNTSGTGLIGLTSEFIAPGGVAIDASGNVWLSGNDGQSVPSSGNVNTGNLPAYVTEVIGIAAPVVTPKSIALTHNTIATRP